MPNPNFLAFVVFEITAFIRTDRQMDRRTWLDQLGYDSGDGVGNASFYLLHSFRRI